MQEEDECEQKNERACHIDLVSPRTKSSTPRQREVGRKQPVGTGWRLKHWKQEATTTPR
jgi:hypothetical protein